MEKRFNSYLDTVDTGFWRDLCMAHGRLRHYEKGEEFITAGAVGRYIGYIEKGALKYECYAEDGSAHVVGLEVTGDFVADFPFSLYGQPSRCSIVATQPSDIYCVPTKWVAEKMHTDAKLCEIIHHSTTEVFAMVYDRSLSMYCKSALERLRDLMRIDPELFQQFSLQDIASLLNITPTHLSRLRKEI